MAEPITFNVRHITDVDIRHPSDEENCNLTGSVFLDQTRLAIVDQKNKNIKVVDITNRNIESILAFQIELWDITFTNNDQLVVTAPDIKSLIVLRTGASLTEERRIYVDGCCYGIDCYDSLLIVSCMRPGSLKFVKIEGHVMRTIDIDSCVKEPYYLVSSRDRQSIYITDYARNKVTKLTTEGHFQANYECNDLLGPLGVTTDRQGNLFVAGNISSNICVLSVQSTQIREIHKIAYPQSILVQDEFNQIILSHEWDSIIIRTIH